MLPRSADLLLRPLDLSTRREVAGTIGTNVVRPSGPLPCEDLTLLTGEQLIQCMPSSVEEALAVLFNRYHRFVFNLNGFVVAANEPGVPALVVSL